MDWYELILILETSFDFSLPLMIFERNGYLK